MGLACSAIALFWFNIHNVNSISSCVGKIKFKDVNVLLNDIQKLGIYQSIKNYRFTMSDLKLKEFYSGEKTTILDLNSTMEMYLLLHMNWLFINSVWKICSRLLQMVKI